MSARGGLSPTDATIGSSDKGGSASESAGERATDSSDSSDCWPSLSGEFASSKELSVFSSVPSSIISEAGASAKRESIANVCL